MSGIGNNIAKADIDLIDGTFESSQSESYHLSIQREPGRLSFCVFNTVINKYVVLRSYPLSATEWLQSSACRSILENDKLLGLNYKSSSCLWLSQRYTLIPHHLFDEKEADLYLTFNQEHVTGEHTLSRYIWSANAYYVFSCPEEWLTLLRIYQPRIRFFHHSGLFIESVIGSSTSSTGKTDVAILFYGRWLDVVVTRGNRLLFYNSFQINAPADSVYYLAGVSNLFDIDLLSTKLMYAGSLSPMLPEIEILNAYVNRIIEFEPLRTVAYSHYITESYRKRFIHLFKLFECES